MELTLANFFPNLQVYPFKNILLDIENFISDAQIPPLICLTTQCSFDRQPLIMESSPIISRRDSTSCEDAISLAEVSLVMTRLGMEGDHRGSDQGNNTNNNCNNYYNLHVKDFVGLFDEEEPSLEEIRETFQVLDVNKDGFIDASDLQRVLSGLGFGEGYDLGKCKNMIQKFDGNGDGLIDFQNFVKLMEKCLC